MNWKGLGEQVLQAVADKLGSARPDGGQGDPWHGNDRQLQDDGERSRDRLAVVYSGKPRVDQACAVDTGKMLRTLLPDYDVVLAGPGAKRDISHELIAESDLWVQPGGLDLDDSFAELKPFRKAVRKRVRSGGHYLGICLGGYLAGATPGFNLLPGDTDQYISARGSEVDHDLDTVLTVNWRGQRRPMLFQDGPVFEVDEDEVDVIARYGNNQVAALTTPFGAGRVAVCGPHPEATADWFTKTHPRHRYVDCRDLAEDLLSSLLA